MTTEDRETSTGNCETRLPVSKRTRELVHDHKRAEDTYNDVIQRLALAVEPPKGPRNEALAKYGNRSQE